MSARFLEVRYLLPAMAVLISVSAFGQAGVRINEVMANNESIRNVDETVTDWVELQNTTGTAIQLGGASLTDNAATPRKWVFPAGTFIPANGYLIVLFDNNRPPSTGAEPLLNAGYGLSAAGETLYLLGSAGNAPLIDSVQFGIQAADYSLGRIGAAWTLNVPTQGQANQAATLGPITSLFVNEWMADPSNGDDWFEIFNSSDNPVELSGLSLTDDPADRTKTVIPARSYIGAGLNGYQVFVADNDAEAGADHVAFALGRSGDTIAIYASNGSVINSVTFGAQDTGVSMGRLPDGTANIVKLAGIDTPGAPNLILFPNLVVSEILSSPGANQEDAVEFFNPTAQPVNISGWYLSDSNTRLNKWRVPANTIVQPGGYVVFYEHQFNNTNDPNAFAFSSTRGDDVYLAEANSAGELTGRIVREDFGPAAPGVSFGLVTTSQANRPRFAALQRPTFGIDNYTSVEQFRQGQGAPNAAPLVGPIVITEIMYHPATNVSGDNVLDEYIEIANISSQTVRLYDPAAPTNSWRLRDAVAFTFPANAELAPNAYALIVPFDPVINAAQATAFRNKYNVPAGVQLFGPYLDKLGNADDKVELYQPGTPDGANVPLIRIDKVDYETSAPWPTTATATGRSIQKRVASSFGNDPANWEAANPTAGRPNGGAANDTDSDGIPDNWETQYQLDPNSAADAALDTDSDGLSNLQEFQAGTHPRDPNSRLAIDDANITVAANGTVRITFATVPGRTYSVLYRDSLQPGTAWQKLQDVNATGSSMTVQDTGAFGRPQRYYQIVTPQR